MLGGADRGSPAFSPPIRENGGLVTRKTSGRIVGKLPGIFSVWFARQIGIGAAVTHRPLPHHRAYGSVHGGSIGYASNPRLTTEDRGTGSKHSIARPRELWTGPSTTDRDRCRRCYPQAAGALPVRAVPRGDDGRFSTVATSRFAVAAGPTE